MSDRISGAEAPSLDRLFDLLSHSRRRDVIDELTTHERALTVNDLTKAIVARECDPPIHDVSGEEVNRIYSSLHHCHLPKLVESRLVEFDEERETVAPSATLDRLEPFLSPVVAADSVSSLTDG